MLGCVFRLRVCFSPVRVVRGAPGVPGVRTGSDRAGLVLLPAAGAVRSGQAGAGRARSRCQQARNASFQGQSALMARVRWRAWRASLAGRCQIR